jgi:hypothetical protein
MITITKFLRPLGLAAATVAASSFIIQSAPAQAIELVTNGAFSAQVPLTGWTVTPGTNTPASSTGIQVAPSGYGFGNVAAVGSFTNLTGPFNATWSQNISTVSGANYTLEYFFANSDNIQKLTPSGSFRVRLGNTTLDSLSGNGIVTGQRPIINFTGTGRTDELSFTFAGINASAFDNVSVNGPAPTTGTSAPEPFTIIGTLIGGSAAIRMRKKLNLSK